ncbi:MAG TPA: TIGR02221 family CRISPR-associated protein, partial [Chthonomonadales bacterium]|nr:TIGR02221 family CRISPR-associated protein [Chthonomonadales bacterium]
MHIVTALGTGKYGEATYVWPDGRECRTRYFPAALVEWLAPASVTVLLTSEAEAHSNWTGFKEEITGRVEVSRRRVPSGQSEEELWRIFSEFTKLPSGEIVLDITHGFRSLPALALLAAAFLRITGNSTLKQVVYGAHDSKDEAGRSRVFDLTPFLSLLEWAAAADTFTQTGDARRIAALARAANNELWRNSDVSNRPH